MTLKIKIYQKYYQFWPFETISITEQESRLLIPFKEYLFCRELSIEPLMEEINFVVLQNYKFENTDL